MYQVSYHEPSPVLDKKTGKNEARGFVRGSGILGDRFSPPQPRSVSAKLYAVCFLFLAVPGLSGITWDQQVGFFFFFQLQPMGSLVVACGI